MQKSARRMVDAQQGVFPKAAADIVVIGSIGGRHITPFSAGYGATKAAVHSLTEGLRREVGPKGVRVTLVEPGAVVSGFQAAAGYSDELVGTLNDKFGPLLNPGGRRGCDILRRHTGAPCEHLRYSYPAHTSGLSLTQLQPGNEETRFPEVCRRSSRRTTDRKITPDRVGLVDRTNTEAAPVKHGSRCQYSGSWWRYRNEPTARRGTRSCRDRRARLRARDKLLRYCARIWQRTVGNQCSYGRLFAPRSDIFSNKGALPPHLRQCPAVHRGEFESTSDGSRRFTAGAQYWRGSV